MVRSWGPASHHGAERSSQTGQASFTLGCWQRWWGECGEKRRSDPSTPTWLWGEVGVMGRFPQSWNHRLQRKTDPKCPPGPFGSDALGPEGSQVLPCCSKCILEPMAPSTRECDCRTEPQRTRFQTHCPRICVLGRSAGDWHAWAN